MFTNQNISFQEYDYDREYFVVPAPGEGKKVFFVRDGRYEIDGDIVDFAAAQLQKVATYICALRERIKLQTRKNYMKGTSVLLRYLVN